MVNWTKIQKFRVQQHEKPCIRELSLKLLADLSPRFVLMANTVLIVDDNSYIRHALCEMFTGEADFDICGEAENGKKAIEEAQELLPDLIVLDLSMPVMNGLDAARVLNRLMPTVPLIMFSDYSDAFSKREARSAGISALVSKSEHASKLIDTARSLLYPTAA